MNFRNLRADEIDLRIGQVFDGRGVTLLCYQNARCGMDILDESVGPENWQREHYEVKGNMLCRVGIKCGSEWVWKADCGTESDIEKQKGESSDSFKRALVNWGIGRELYSSPFIWITLPKSDFENGKVKKAAQKMISSFKVKEVEYNGKDMTKLVIVADDGSVVYNWSSKDAPKDKVPVEAKLVTKANVEALVAKCMDKNVPEQTILKSYKVKSLEDLTREQWMNAMRRLDATLPKEA